MLFSPTYQGTDPHSHSYKDTQKPMQILETVKSEVLDCVYLISVSLLASILPGTWHIVGTVYV